MSATRGTVTERLVCGYVTAVPLLWVLGLTLPVAFLLFGVLALGVRERRAVAYAWPWLLVAACQVASLVVNLTRDGEPAGVLAKQLVASPVSGWFLFAAAVAVGASGAVRPAPFLAAVRRFGLACVAAGLVLLPVALLSGRPWMSVVTPVGALVPDDLPAKRFSFTMQLFVWEDLFGIDLPRFATFHPWSTALGFSGVCLTLVMLNLPDRRQRAWGVASGVFMVLASMGRLAGLALLACLALRWLLARPVAALAPAACAALLAATLGWMALLVAGGGVAARAAAARTAFESARPGASEARELIAEETWHGIREAPLLGHGRPGDPVYPDEYAAGGTMVVGSHSTVTGLVYVGGLLTFAAFAFAFVRTAALVARSRADPPLARNTFVLLCGMALVAFGETLSALVLPSLFAFVWLGLALARCRGAVAETA